MEVWALLQGRDKPQGDAEDGSPPREPAPALPWVHGAAPLPRVQRCAPQPGRGAPGGPSHPDRISAMQEKRQNPSTASGGDELFIRLQPALAFRELA